MEHQAIGVFFDGNSSLPKEVVFVFDSSQKLLIIKGLEGVFHQWKWEDIEFEKNTNKLVFRNRTDVSQSGNTNDPVFIQEIIGFTKKEGSDSLYQRLLDLGVLFHAGIAIAILALVTLGYLYVIPWAAEKSVVLIPDHYDDKLGDTFFEQNILLTTIDSTKTKALTDFAKELKLSNKKKLKFFVVNSETVNAYALPDGNIVVYTAILDSMKNYEELVGLLGHEAAHVNQRHAMKMLCRNLSGYLFVSAVLGDVNGIMATIGDNINSLQSLSFSREFEQQADIDGFNSLITNKINPRGMVNLFKRLEDKNNLDIPPFLSSHPLTGDRIGSIEKMIRTKNFEIQDNKKLRELFFILKN